jgi:hypothetical protein
LPPTHQTATVPRPRWAGRRQSVTATSWILFGCWRWDDVSVVLFVCEIQRVRLPPWPTGASRPGADTEWRWHDASSVAQADLSLSLEQSSRTGWPAEVHVPRPQNHTVVLRSANPAHQKPTRRSTTPRAVRRNEATGIVTHSRAKPQLRSSRTARLFHVSDRGRGPSIPVLGACWHGRIILELHRCHDRVCRHCYVERRAV